MQKSAIKIGRPKIKIERSELEKLYEKERLSIERIAKKYACSYATIQRRLHEFNLNIRPSSGLKYLN